MFTINKQALGHLIFNQAKQSLQIFFEEFGQIVDLIGLEFFEINLINLLDATFFVASELELF